MVFLNSDDPSCKDYLESTDVLPTLQAAVEAMLKKYAADQAPSETPPNPQKFLAEWLKRNNPKYNAEFAAQVAKIREAPGYGTSNFAAEAAIVTQDVAAAASE